MLFKCAAAVDGCSKFARDVFDNLRSFDRSIKIHTKSKVHVRATMHLSNVRIEHSIDEGASIQLTMHNENYEVG